MKSRPARLLLTLMLGIGASIPTFADDSKDSSVAASSAECSGQLVTACGMKIVKTSCTGHTVSSDTKSSEADDPNHLSKDKDSSPKNDRDYNDDSQAHHVDRSNDMLGSKVSICHRMGGAEVTLLVANDGWLSGHSNHPLDTIGRCADFDAEQADSTKKDSDRKISASTSGYSMGLTPNQIACLKGSPSSQFTINGKTYPGAGLNSSAFSISVQPTGQGPSRGGARSLH